jgi:hypothetical protein
MVQRTRWAAITIGLLVAVAALGGFVLPASWLLVVPLLLVLVAAGVLVTAQVTTQTPAPAMVPVRTGPSRPSRRIR